MKTPSTHTVIEKIDLLMEEKYNGYRGRMMKPIGKLHSVLRNKIGDEKFLEFLEAQEGMPKYEPLTHTVIIVDDTYSVTITGGGK